MLGPRHTHPFESMRPPLFVGSGVALVTPFSDHGPDESVLRELVRFHLDAGTDALVVNGSTGEAVTMTPSEQKRSIEVVVEETGGRIPVIAGAGGSDTAAVVQLGVNARDAGADGLLLAPPPYNKPSQQGIVAHFRAVLDAADLPLVIYNVPGRTACNILPATVEEIATDPRVRGVKEASGDIAQIGELCRRLAGTLAIYSGNDDHVVPVLALGGVGVISVLANVAPADTAAMVRRFRDGDVEGAAELQHRYRPLIDTLFREPNPVPVKAAVAELGFAVGAVRLPLLPASGDTLEILRSQMRELGLETRTGATA
jgi:4-hydroxy-tetrahydrodipicolinate synthase